MSHRRFRGSIAGVIAAVLATIIVVGRADVGSAETAAPTDTAVTTVNASANAPATPADPGLVPIGPVRVLDTRPGELQVGYSGGKPAAGETVELQVAGAAGGAVPADASAAVLNITGTQASTDAFVTVWPCGSPRPLASNLNLAAGATSPNLVIAKLGVGGKVCLFTSGPAQLVADLAGYFPAASGYVPAVPVRVLDTRPGELQVGYSGGKPAAGETVELQVAGAAGGAVPADASAAVLNITGTQASTDAFVTVWPCGSPRPLASNLNLAAGATSPNLVIAKLGVGGKVCLFTSGPAQLVADLAGYFPAASGYVPAVPVRVLDTRPGELQVGYSGGKPAAGETVELQVAGAAGGAVPADASAAVLNITGTQASTDAFVTVWPCGSPRPLASNLNLAAGATSPNLVIAKLGVGGKVCLFTSGPAQLVADLAGYFSVASLPAAGSQRPLLIKHGWDMPYPAWIQSHVGQMEQLGFDGVVTTLGDLSAQINSQTPVSYEQIRAALAPLAQTRFTTMTHNFVIVYAGSNQVFDDNTIALQNFANLARAAREAGLEGIVYDNENYSGGPGWAWPAATPNRTLDEAQQQSRTRGRQAMQAMTAAWPNVTLLAFYGPWVSDPSTGTRYEGVIPYNDVSWANQLLGPWVLGMIEAARGTSATVVDGGEVYSLRSPAQFDQAYRWAKADIAVSGSIVPTEMRSTYAQSVNVGFGVFDQPSNGIDMNPGGWRDTIANALNRTDRYVWAYTERYDWWGTGWPTARAPQAWIDATLAAKQLVRR